MSVDKLASLEECFRCLLAVALQQPLPNMMARSVYDAALGMEAQLPPDVLKSLSALLKPGLLLMDDQALDSLITYLDLDGADDVDTGDTADLLLEVSKG